MANTFLLISHLPIPARHHHVSPRMSLKQPPNPSSSLLTSITNLLWGSSLPPSLLISTVRTSWHSTWQLMMSQLAPSDSSGRYSRPTSKFRITNNNNNDFNLLLLHLYVGLACPWAHRTLIVRALKGLEEAVPVSIASPGLDGSWEFNPVPVPNRDIHILIPTLDNANGCRNLKQVYRLRKEGYNGRSTVPMLWDVQNKEVVCNESYDIIQFLNSGLNGLAANPGLDLSPTALKGNMEEWNRIIYPNVNNGVYR